MFSHSTTFKVRYLSVAVNNLRQFYGTIFFGAVLIAAMLVAARPAGAAFESLQTGAEDVFFKPIEKDSLSRRWSSFSYCERFGLSELSVRRGRAGGAHRGWIGEVEWADCGDDLYRENRVAASGTYIFHSAKLSLSASVNSLYIKGYGSDLYPGTGISAEILKTPFLFEFGMESLLPVSRMSQRVTAEPSWWGSVSITPDETWSLRGWWWTTGLESPSLHLGVKSRLHPNLTVGLAFGDNPERGLGLVSLQWNHLTAGCNVVWQPRLGWTREVSMGLVFNCHSRESGNPE